uniref:Amidase domain-containing protein n=1 Tax=Mesocestoides corti TaxID=53468 RepID=A0A5K3FZA5_MESCO
MTQHKTSMAELVDDFWNFLTEVDKWKVIGSVSITFLTIVLIRRMARKRNVMGRLRKKQKQLQEARSRLRDRVRTYPPLSHLKELDALQVQQRLQANEMTPLEALRLYQKRMVDALESNCICEIIEEAEAVAMSVSADVQSPIRGMPVSLKECTEVAGYDSP